MFSHYGAGWSLVCVLVSDGLITLFVTIAIGLLYHHIFDSAGLAFYSACITVKKVLNVNFHMKQVRQARFKKTLKQRIECLRQRFTCACVCECDD